MQRLASSRSGRLFRTRSQAVLLLVAGSWCLATSAFGQSVVSGAVVEAQRLRDTGQLTAAVELLQTQLASNPNDGEAARLLAQTLYWLRDLSGARRAYDDALQRHPEDTTLRLEYGRMLVETRAWAPAEALLTPLQQLDGPRARATALLGTMAYWQGDLSRAQRLFMEALSLDSNQPEIAGSLRQIRNGAAPWVRISSNVRHDDQPLDYFGAGIEAGWFATPLVPLTMHFKPKTYRLPGGVVRRAWSAEGMVDSAWPSRHLETQLAAGVLQRDVPDGIEWTGRAALGVRVASAVKLRVRAERAPYLHTPSSLETSVNTDTIAGLVRLDHPRGWLGEVGMEQQYFPDANRIRSQYAWLLMPLSMTERLKLQGGYAFEHSNADESRFEILTQPYDPSDPRFTTAGHYVPYYTPINLQSHSAVAALSIDRSPRVAIRVSGSYGFRARDDSPVFFVVNGVVNRFSYRRTYSPWKVGGSLVFPVNQRTTFGVAGEGGRTAFYSWSAVDVFMTFRFVSTETASRR